MDFENVIIKQNSPALNVERVTLSLFCFELFDWKVSDFNEGRGYTNEKMKAEEFAEIPLSL